MTGTLNVQRFTRKPETVEAVQVTEDNMAEVAEWRGVEHPAPGWALPVVAVCGDGARPGDWVVRNGGVLYEDEVEQYWQPALPSTAQVTEYRLRPVPRSVAVDGRHWDIYVRRFGETDRWVVGTIFDGEYANVDGEWSWSVRRYLDTEAERAAWDAAFLFALDQAIAVADKVQWTKVVNGKTARDVLAKRGEGS